MDYRTESRVGGRRVNRVSLVCLCASVLFAAGCQNPYTTFYSPILPEDQRGNLLPFSGETRLLSASSSDEFAKLNIDLQRQSYALLGSVAFTSGGGNYVSAVNARAKELAADVVLLRAAHEGSIQGVLPVVTVQPGQTSTTTTTGTASANVYGPGGTGYGNAVYSGQSQTTTMPTSHTTLVPATFERYGFYAGFYRKRTYPFGAFWSPLTNEQRRTLQRNGGLMVDGVVDGSPAFDANILPGDVLISIASQPITTSEGLSQLVASLNGRTVAVGVIRGGVEKTVNIHIGEGRE